LKKARKSGYRPIPRRILMVVSTITRAGCERRVIATAEGLIEQGYVVNVLVMNPVASGEPIFEAEFKKLGAKFVSDFGPTAGGSTAETYHALLDHSLFLPNEHECARAIAHAIGTIRPEVVHGWGDQAAIMAGMVACLLGVPRVILGQTAIAPVNYYAGDVSIYLDRYRALLKNPAVTMVTNSYAAASDYENWIGLPKNTVPVIYNGLRPITVRIPKPAEVAAYRASLGFPEGVPVIGSLGRFEPQKDPMLWLQTAAEILRTRTDARFLLAGYGSLPDAEPRSASIGISLRTTQNRLVQTEKLASLGQLTAGIAHEIKNPLNFVNNFSGVSVELIDELQDTLKGIPFDDKARAEINELTDTLRGNLDKVVQHGTRADSIVKNMLLHSRQGPGERRLIDVNTLVEESFNLAYHGARAEKKNFDVMVEQALDPAAGKADLFPQEITRVLLNLISNGVYATAKKAQTNGASYKPTLIASTKSLGDRVEIKIRDNGTGIPPEIKDKMFNPFFTTKPAGEGTGLGLSISYDIVVKQHGGSVEIDTQPGEFTEVKIILPRTPASAT
jgi:signal transduction histidine kinase